MQQPEGGAPYTNFEKYRAVPRQKVPVEEDEIRVSVNGRIPRYVVYAASLMKEKGKKKVTIKATGNAIANAITLAEILKRRFPDVHQQNLIGTTRSVDTYEPVEEGLDQVVHERHVPFIEIILALEQGLLDIQVPGYQPPIDQALVRPLTDYPNTSGGSRRGGGYRGYRRGGRRGRMGGQYGNREDDMGSVEMAGGGGRYGGSIPRRGGYRGRVRRYRGGGSYRGNYRGGQGYRGNNMGGRQQPS